MNSYDQAISYDLVDVFLTLFHCSIEITQLKQCADPNELWEILIDLFFFFFLPLDLQTEGESFSLCWSNMSGYALPRDAK